MTNTFILLTLLVLAACQIEGTVSDDEFPTVTIAQGTLKGQKVTSDDVAPYYRFLGIPYAKPPLGNLRFKAPAAADSWNGTLEALQERSICKQPITEARVAQMGDEDCLYLNVFTPQLPGSGPLKTVMVWIHGGGFSVGSGGLLYQGPQYLVNEGVVYVSLNYRLSIFGFLSTQDAVVPGNAGLKDQALALRWVQQNIAAFGGDPDTVTIFGESAGGASINYHLLSPMSEGLFHRAIAQSGSTYCTWSRTDRPRENAFLVGQTLGFSGESSEELVAFLRNVSAEDLMTASFDSINEVDKPRLMNVFHEVPTLEPVVEGEEAFITENPLTLLEQGRFQKVPFLSGVTSAEGLYLVGVGILVAHRSLEEIDENFLKVFKPELRVCKDQPCGDELVAKIRSFYFGDQPLSNDNFADLVDMCTDMSFNDGVLYGVKKMSLLSPEPVYFYQFSYDGGFAYVKKTIPEIANYSGVAHADDLGYLFDLGMGITGSPLDLKVRSRMVSLWTNFVKTGNPTPNVSDEFPAWLPYTSNATNYLEIGATLEAKTDFLKKRTDFWDALYSSKTGN